MFVLNGKYNSATVYTDMVDDKGISQIIWLLNQEFAADSRICMMPHTHAGAGCGIGPTMTINDKAGRRRHRLRDGSCHPGGERN